jgi:hypothetical protein
MTIFATNFIAKLQKPRQDSQDGPARTGQLVMDRTARTGLPGQDSQNRTTTVEQTTILD